MMTLQTVNAMSPAGFRGGLRRCCRAFAVGSAACGECAALCVARRRWSQRFPTVSRPRAANRNWRSSALIPTWRHARGSPRIRGASRQGAGLDSLNADEFARFTHLNELYKSKFDFPFIFAVKGATKQQILDSFAERISNSPEDEFALAIEQICRIFRFSHRRQGRGMTRVIRGQTLSFGETPGDLRHEEKGAIVDRR